MTTNEIPNVAPVQSAPADPSDVAAIARARGVLVSLEITTWSARRLDKRVTKEATRREGADDDAGRFNKHLLGGKVESHSAVIAAAGAARVAHYRETLPWADEGARLLPIGNYFEYAKIVRDERAKFAAAVETFLQEYPNLQADAARRLGAMYDPSDYPHVSDVAKRFTFRVHFSPVPAASDIRVDLPPEVTAHIERSVTARVENAVHGAVTEGWNRLAESVARIRDRLTEIAGMPEDGPAGRLHASIFAGAVETAETLKRLNVLGDPALDAMADRIVSELSGLDPKAIRKDPAAMSETAKRADDILSAMAGFYGEGGAS
ncbi:MAG: hypothetical protein M0R28_20965 [Pigmentiphaga sp.]|nr:hypothetical protein [Pigmentiphaga sp.]